MSDSTLTPKGWFSRTTALPFTPISDTFKLALLSGVTRGNPNGNLVLALFSPNIAINRLGQVTVVEPADFDAIIALSEKVLPIPDIGAWTTVKGGNDIPPDVLHVQLPFNIEVKAFKKIVVDGFRDGETRLRDPVGRFDELPEPLVKLLTVVAEAKDISENTGPVDEDLVKKVRSLLGNPQV